MKLTSELEKWNYYYTLSDIIIKEKYILELCESFFQTSSIPRICLLCMYYKFYGLYNFLILTQEKIYDRDEYPLFIYKKKVLDKKDVFERKFHCQKGVYEKYFYNCLITLPNKLILKTFEKRKDIFDLFNNDFDFTYSILHKKILVQYFHNKDFNFLHKVFILSSEEYTTNIAYYLKEEVCETNINLIKLVLNNLKKYNFDFNTKPKGSNMTILRNLQNGLRGLVKSDTMYYKTLIGHYEYAIDFIKAL